MLNILNVYAIPILITHIIAGGISLLLSAVDALYVFAAKPSNARFPKRSAATHRIIWSLFHGAMAIVGLTGIALSFVSIPPSYFLFSVALFTLYMVIAASRALLGTAPHLFDTFLGIAMAVIGTVMVIYGLYGLIAGAFGFVVAPLIVFGGIGAAFGISDFRFFTQHNRSAAVTQEEFHARFFSRNFGALIATLTAFLTVNVESQSVFANILVWVGPTIILSPMINYFVRIYRSDSAEQAARSSVGGRFEQHIRNGFKINHEVVVNRESAQDALATKSIQ